MQRSPGDSVAARGVSESAKSDDAARRDQQQQRCAGHPGERYEALLQPLEAPAPQRERKPVVNRLHPNIDHHLTDSNAITRERR